MRNSFKEDTPGGSGESGGEIGMLLLFLPLQGLHFAIISPLSPPCCHHVANR